MNRPPNLGDRLYYTDQELAEREGQIVKQQERDRQEFVAPDQRVGTGPPNHWGDRAKRPCKQTSLVVDPPDGRMPDLLPEAKTRPLPQGAGIENPKADSWEDFSYYIRCISRGVTGSIFPVVYGNGQQIIQAPGYVTILEEMVHEARVIPLDGRPHAGPNIRSYMGDSRGHWEGNTLVVETTNFLGNRTIRKRSRSRSKSPSRSPWSLDTRTSSMPAMRAITPCLIPSAVPARKKKLRQ
jgi:hypothetical protein